MSSRERWNWRANKLKRTILETNARKIHTAWQSWLKIQNSIREAFENFVITKRSKRRTWYSRWWWYATNARRSQANRRRKGRWVGYGLAIIKGLWETNDLQAFFWRQVSYHSRIFQNSDVFKETKKRIRYNIQNIWRWPWKRSLRI